MKKLLKYIFKKILSNFKLINFFKGQRFIFLYHDVSEINEVHNSSHYSISKKNFIEHLNFLKDNFHIVSLDPLISDKKLPKNKNYAAITFDDGFFSILNTANPLMKKYNFPYSVFINGAAMQDNESWISNIIINISNKKYLKKICKVSSIGLSKSKNEIIKNILERGIFNQNFINNYYIKNNHKIFLNKEDVLKLFKDGVQIESHSYDHLVLSRTDEKILKNQIIKNKKLLNSLKVSYNLYFSIPFGKKQHYNNKIIEIIKSQGYKYILNTNPSKLNIKDIGQKQNLLPRISSQESTKELLYNINRTLFFNYDI